MTDQDKKILNSLVPLEEINYHSSTKTSINITSTPINSSKDILLPKPKKLTLKKDKHY